MRIFTAFPLTKEVKNSIERAQKNIQEKLSELDVRWTRPENTHVTLEFLGDITESQLEALKDTIQYEVKRLASFSFIVEGLDVFPNFYKPSVLILRLKDEQKISEQLRKNLHDNLHLKQITTDYRTFQPHITLGRFRESRKISREIFSDIPVEKISWKVNRVDLYNSVLGQSGPTYELLNSYPLK